MPVLKTKTIMIAAQAIFLAAFLSGAYDSQGSASQVAVDPDALPGIQTGPMPWPTEIDHLSQRLQAIGLPALAAEGTALHIHQHLDIIIDGTHAVVPAGIGINEAARFISPVHTHDDTGVIHVESNEIRDFTLGQFFDIWGVRFTKNCVGGYCSSGRNRLQIFSNGKRVTGDPRALVLKSHQEIALVYGPPNAARSVPSSYRFAPGL